MLISVVVAVVVVLKNIFAAAALIRHPVANLSVRASRA